MKYDYLIFDLDDTLFDFKGGELAGLQAVFSKFGFQTQAQIDTAITTYLKINHQLWSAFEKGEIQKSTIQSTRFQQTLKTLGISGDGKAMEKAYRQTLNTNYRLLPGATEFLEKLSWAEYHLIAGTNGETQTQYLRLQHTGLASFFEAVYISDEMGVAKPNPRFFEMIADDFPKMTKQNTVMIGDGIASDMRGGIAAGLDTIWLNLNHTELPTDVCPTSIAESYDDILNVLI